MLKSLPQRFYYFGRLVDWSIGRLVDWSIGRLVDWSIGSSV
ncbi:TPA: hypothetical protein ACXK60_001599 [Haemophilus influenzae]